MTEYDYSPEGQRRHVETQARIARWAQATEFERPQFRAPFGVRSDAGDDDQDEVPRSPAYAGNTGYPLPPPQQHGYSHTLQPPMQHHARSHSTPSSPMTGSPLPSFGQTVAPSAQSYVMQPGFQGYSPHPHAHGPPPPPPPQQMMMSPSVSQSSYGSPRVDPYALYPSQQYSAAPTMVYANQMPQAYPQSGQPYYPMVYGPQSSMVATPQPYVPHTLASQSSSRKLRKQHSSSLSLSPPTAYHFNQPSPNLSISPLSSSYSSPAMSSAPSPLPGPIIVLDRPRKRSKSKHKSSKSSKSRSQGYTIVSRFHYSPDIRC